MTVVNISSLLPFKSVTDTFSLLIENREEQYMSHLLFSGRAKTFSLTYSNQIKSNQIYLFHNIRRNTLWWLTPKGVFAIHIIVTQYLSYQNIMQ